MTVPRGVGSVFRDQKLNGSSGLPDVRCGGGARKTRSFDIEMAGRCRPESAGFAHQIHRLVGFLFSRNPSA